MQFYYRNIIYAKAATVKVKIKDFKDFYYIECNASVKFSGSVLDSPGSVSAPTPRIKLRDYIWEINVNQKN